MRACQRTCYRGWAIRCKSGHAHSTALRALRYYPWPRSLLIRREVHIFGCCDPLADRYSMIKNLPTQQNFKGLAKDCLLQTTNNLFEITKDYTGEKHDVYSDLDENEIWGHHRGDLRTCLVLLYQALELYLKGEICKESPYLLLETPRHDWPTNPESIDKDFNELFTISADQLLRTFNAIYTDTEKKKDINKIFNDIRKKRNIITHSSPTFDITPQYLIETCIKCFTLFEGNDEWWLQTKQNIVDHPLFGYGDYDYELANLAFRLDFIKEKVGLKFLNKHSDIDLTARKYYCPYCSHYLSDIGHQKSEITKWAMLYPNKPDSTNLLCYSCQNTFTVTRIKCTSGDCKGNVVSDSNVCLTCLKEVDDD